jgi:GH25 family lysozyme M1 (1,4-beta-N-acetylmuramidase)
MSGTESRSIESAQRVRAAVRPTRSREGETQQISVIAADLQGPTSEARLEEVLTNLRRSAADGDLVFLHVTSSARYRQLVAATFTPDDWTVFYGKADNDRPIAYRRSMFAKVAGSITLLPDEKVGRSHYLTHLQLNFEPLGIDLHVVSASSYGEAKGLIQSGAPAIGWEPHGTPRQQPNEGHVVAIEDVVRESTHGPFWLVDGDATAWRREPIALPSPAIEVGDDDSDHAFNHTVLSLSMTKEKARSRLPASRLGFDIDCPYPPKRMLDGVDTSHHQAGKIDLRAAQADGVRFWYVKATEGSVARDKTYRRRVRQARRAGLPVGAYHFARGDRADAEEEARHFLKHADIRAGDMLPMLDVEGLQDVARPELTAWTRQWVDTVRARLARHGLAATPIIYTPYDLDDDFGAQVWVARYSNDFRAPVIPEPWTKAAIWQHSNGRFGPIKNVPGFGPVNVNALHPDIPLSSLVVVPINDQASEQPATTSATDQGQVVRLPSSAPPTSTGPTKASKIPAVRNEPTLEVTFELSEVEARYLRQLEVTTGLNAATNIMRALRLLNVLERADNNDGTITVTYPDGRTERLHLH